MIIFTMESDAASDSKARNEFLMEVGGSGEYAPSKGIFLKFKGAYTFLQKQTGSILTAKAGCFPSRLTAVGTLTSGPTSRPVIGIELPNGWSMRTPSFRPAFTARTRKWV